MSASALAALQDRRQRLLLAALLPGDEGPGESAGAARAALDEPSATAGELLPPTARRASALLRHLHPSACAAADARKPILLTSLTASGGVAAAGLGLAASAAAHPTSSDAAPPVPPCNAAAARKRLPWAHLHESEAAAAASDAAWALAQRLESAGEGPGAAGGDGAAHAAAGCDLEALVAALIHLEELSDVVNSYDDVEVVDRDGGSSSSSSSSSSNQAGEQRRRHTGVEFVRPDVEAAIRDSGSPRLQRQHRLIMADGWRTRFAAAAAAANETGTGAEGHTGGGIPAAPRPRPRARVRAAEVERALAGYIPTREGAWAAEALLSMYQHKLQYEDLRKRFESMCARDVAHTEAVLQQVAVIRTVVNTLAPPVHEGRGPDQPPRVGEGLPMPLDTLVNIARSLRGSCFTANAAARKLERFQKGATRAGGGGAGAAGGISSGSKSGNTAEGGGDGSNGTSSNSISATIELAVLRHDAAATRDWEQLVALARAKGSPTPAKTALCVLKDAILGLALLRQHAAGPGAHRNAVAAAAYADGGPLLPLACATVGALYRCSIESVRRQLCPSVLYTCLAYGPTRLPSPTSLEASEAEPGAATSPASRNPLAALVSSWQDAETETDRAAGPPPARYSWKHTNMVDVHFSDCGPLLAAEAALRIELLFGGGAALGTMHIQIYADALITARLEQRFAGLNSLARCMAERDAAHDGVSGGGGSGGMNGRAKGSSSGSGSGSGAAGPHEPNDYGAGLFEAFYEEWDSAGDSGEGEGEDGPEAAGQSVLGGGDSARLLRRLQLRLRRHVSLDAPFTPWGRDSLEGGADLLRGVLRATEAFVRAACARLRQQGRPAPLPGVEGTWYEELISSVGVWKAWLDQSHEKRASLLDCYQLEAAGYGGAKEDSAGSGGVLAMVLQKVRFAMDSGAAEAEEELRAWQQRCQQRAEDGCQRESGNNGERAEERRAEAEAARKAQWRRRRYAAGRWLTGRRLIDAAEALRPGLLQAHTDSWARLLAAAAAATARFKAVCGEEEAEEADTPMVFTDDQDVVLYQIALTALWGLCLLRPLPADQLPHMRLSTVLAVAAYQRCTAQTALEEFRQLQDDLRRRRQMQRHRQAAGGPPTPAEEEVQQADEEATYDELAESLASGPSDSRDLFNVLSRLPSPFVVRPEPAWAAWPAHPPDSPTAIVREAAAQEPVSPAGEEEDLRLRAARSVYAARQLPYMLQLYDRHGGLLVSLAEAVGWLRAQWQRRQPEADPEAEAEAGPASGAPGQQPDPGLIALLEEAVAAAAEAGAAAVAGGGSESGSGLPGAAPDWGPDQLREWRVLLQHCAGEALVEGLGTV
ncbi:hypothetical protein HYH02_009088 [Chlamydomonas schloesseri]|uniref:Uncharacterized protein n=1 Tax=Chlamydomonas schloesseri TaxID=2026947 RepID=A0A835WB50_9CHLO|nr:hypothetical protein HYH02_009088 [Chlamydomonas schloesseri]|eukprot:KAG2444149.1 hypothetical protein HYH02_009088 [Chlamydomonas schloesseri]